MNEPVIRVSVVVHEKALNDLVEAGVLAAERRREPKAVAEAIVELVQTGGDARMRRLDEIDRLWNIMFNKLREAKEQFYSEDGSPRRAAAFAVRSVFDFLFAFDNLFQNENLLVPLQTLINDLMKLDDGYTGPTMKRPKRTGPPLAGAEYNAVKGLAVFTAQRLEASGVSSGEARKQVAHLLSKFGIRPMRKGARGSGDFTERTIKGWEEEIASDLAATRFQTSVYKRYVENYLEEAKEFGCPDNLLDLPHADEIRLRQIGKPEFRNAHLTVLSLFLSEYRRSLLPQEST